MSLISREDFRDVLIKGMQRGWPFILSKLNFSGQERTKSAFNTTGSVGANWWDIPYVRKRWNEKITGDADKNYETYLSKDLFRGEHNISLVSIGSGVCSHEMQLAELNPTWNIYCIDIADSLLNKASEISKEKGLTNIHFINTDILKHDLKKNYYDIVLFHSSLHHFNHIEEFLLHKILPVLKDNGKLVINEFVGKNRLQFDKHQIDAINHAIVMIDKKYRVIYKTSIMKNKFYGSGLLRMIVADPSECIDSESILPSINKYFNVIEERPYGGNILMSTLKSIAHHYVELDREKQKTLDDLFDFEDKYIETHQSDFVFGVYEKK